MTNNIPSIIQKVINIFRRLRVHNVSLLTIQKLKGLLQNTVRVYSNILPTDPFQNICYTHRFVRFMVASFDTIK